MKIFDAHVHIYPDKIAEKATISIGEFYDLNMTSNGTIANLLSNCDKVGVSKCLVHSVATTHEQVEKINNFLIASVRANPQRFVGFAALHPSMDLKETEKEVDRVISEGLKGIKLHPDFQHFNIDDKHAMEMYEVIDGRIPILFHVGDSRYSFSDPERLAVVAKRFPKQKVICAHLGGYQKWERGVKCLSDLPNVYTDECSSLPFLTPETAREYILAFGTDRVFFGTDYPMWNVEEELERFDRIDLSDSDREKILYNNIAGFLGVE
ncbi:MAG: amidohydrolase family protein [Ruminiclostridium sp.]